MAPSRSMRRRWKQRALGAGALILLLVVGGPFVYIHFIEGPAPAAFSLASQPTTTTVTAATGTSVVPTTLSGGAAAVDGVWNVATGSQAGYRIKETLFGQSNTAVGRTTAVTGSINIAGTTVSSGTFSVDLTQVSSDQSQRDDQFQNRIMNTSSFPTATFTLTQSIQLATLPADGVQTSASVNGNLTMHGKTRTVTFQVSARRSGTTIQVTGSIPITFADYNISNPSGGPATTEDHGILEFLITFTHS